MKNFLPWQLQELHKYYKLLPRIRQTFAHTFSLLKCGQAGAALSRVKITHRTEPDKATNALFCLVLCPALREASILDHLHCLVPFLFSPLFCLANSHDGLWRQANVAPSIQCLLCTQYICYHSIYLVSTESQHDIDALARVAQWVCWTEWGTAHQWYQTLFPSNIQAVNRNINLKNAPIHLRIR